MRTRGVRRGQAQRRWDRSRARVRRFNLTGLLAVGPLLACARCNGRMTALVAGWALALYAVVAVVTATTRTTLEEYRFGTVAVAGALAVFAATVRSRREGALITISERVQHAILRPLPAELGGMAFASHYQSATTRLLSAATFMTSR